MIWKTINLYEWLIHKEVKNKHKNETLLETYSLPASTHNIANRFKSCYLVWCKTYFSSSWNTFSLCHISSHGSTFSRQESLTIIFGRESDMLLLHWSYYTIFIFWARAFSFWKHEHPKLTTFHWHVQNATIPCRSQELLPFLSVIYPFPPTSLPSSLTSSCHLFLGLSLSLVNSKFIYNTFWEFYSNGMTHDFNITRNWIEHCYTSSYLSLWVFFFPLNNMDEHKK